MLFRPSRTAGVVAGCMALASVVSATASAQVIDFSTGSGRAVIAGTAPAWATPAAKVGVADGATVRHIAVALPLRDERSAQAQATAISKPGSHQYRHPLTASQFVDRFAPTDSTVQAITNWLHSQGISVGKISVNKQLVDASASTAVLERAFGTQLARFRTQIGGSVRELVAPATPVSVPANLRGDVAAVIGLDDSTAVVHPQQVALRGADSAQPAAANTNCARYWGEQVNDSVPIKYANGDQSNLLCGYLTAQARGIYGLGASNTGAGASIGLVGAYSLATAVDDANRAASHFGNTPLSQGQFTVVPPAGGYNTPASCESPDAWGGEEDLDVQASHTTAPGAGLTWFAASDCTTSSMLDALNTAVAQDTVSVVSNSWLVPGELSVPQSVRDAFTNIAVEASIQGQAVLFSSGDAGDNSGVPGNNGQAQPGFPASDPWVTAVGGTAVALDSAGHTRFQTGWEDSGEVLSNGQWTPLPDGAGKFAGGSGGGTSQVYAEPDYQRGVVPDSVASGHRAVPDIAMLASGYTGLAVGNTSQQYGYREGSDGGTSLASPLLAGLVADAEQAQGVSRFGFLNTAIYALSGTAAITDVTPHPAGVWTPGLGSAGGVSVPGTRGDYLVDFDARPQSLQSATGWDDVTGVGTPSAAFLTQLGK
jgi:subtilase family serine protease